MVSVFIVALSALVRRWTELGCPPADEETVLAIHMVEYYSGKE